MKVLYLTPAWFGFEEMLYDGQREITGLPSFSYPLKALVEKGHEVDMIVIYTDELRPLNIEAEWVSKINIVAFFKYELSLFKKVKSIFQYRRLVGKILDSGNYDFVYAHGSSPAVARSIVVKKGIPFGQRLYGTFLWSKIEKFGHFRVAVKHLVEYLSFTKEKSFLLATNDGSGADKVVRKIFPKNRLPYEFHYWKNGVSRPSLTDRDLSSFSGVVARNKPFIFYCARFDDWKRQDRIVSVLNRLKDEGIILHAYFAGPFDTLGDRYYKEVIELANTLGVIEQCHFLGSISKKEIFMYNKLALASLSLYDVCNITSVFHEMMASGALMIVKNDDDVRYYIKNRENGVLVDNDEDVVIVLKDILNNPEKYNSCRENIISLSKELTSDWDVRSNKEIELIENHVLKSKKV
ncbi:glycosyltransferase [Aeromonas caviae]|uniref:glycosyltransferase family 4 protein n=1 Tax=Aeromonas caviae TaxID=648 RepID=UPI001D09BE09|nr:glycosyltransferase [Aeromonas caviae]UDN25714.1 glycosyltransferase [Aeromonas caviae]